ncbi:MAG: hypothetical protein HWE14_13960 [Flavobacteriia bacterium]|nr:hypothetical protein [Flavobacteriia bacterium]
MRILLIDTTHPSLPALLARAGFELVDGTTWTETEIHNALPEMDGVVIRSRIPVQDEFFTHAINLKCIGRFGAGLENINLDLAKSKKIVCHNVPKGNRQAVGEHALALLLNLLNHIRKADSEVRKGVWDRHGNTGTELSGKTVGIIGLGNMGQSFAKVLGGFDVDIIAYDPYLQHWPANNVRSVSLKELQASSDIISIHTPLTEETRGWINQSFWTEVKKQVYLINTARGPIVNTEALLDSIREGKVIGAGLDVLEFESKSFKLNRDSNPILQELLKSDKVILSPHVGGWTAEAFQKMGELLAQKMIRTLKG